MILTISVFIYAVKFLAQVKTERNHAKFANKVVWFLTQNLLFQTIKTKKTFSTYFAWNQIKNSLYRVLVKIF